MASSAGMGSVAPVTQASGYPSWSQIDVSGGGSAGHLATAGTATSTQAGGLAAFAAANPVLVISLAAAAAIAMSAGGFSAYEAYQRAKTQGAVELEGKNGQEALRLTCINILMGLRSVPGTQRMKQIEKSLKDSGAVSYMINGKLRTLKNWATINQAANDMSKIDVFYYRPDKTPDEVEKETPEEEKTEPGLNPEVEALKAKINASGLSDYIKQRHLELLDSGEDPAEVEGSLARMRAAEDEKEARRL